MTESHLSSALDEETARAELYGLIAELFYAPPRAELLAQLRVAATDAPAAGGFLEERVNSWAWPVRWTTRRFKKNTTPCLAA